MWGTFGWERTAQRYDDYLVGLLSWLKCTKNSKNQAIFALFSYISSSQDVQHRVSRAYAADQFAGASTSHDTGVGSVPEDTRKTTVHVELGLVNCMIFALLVWHQPSVSDVFTHIHELLAQWCVLTCRACQLQDANLLCRLGGSPAWSSGKSTNDHLVS